MKMKRMLMMMMRVLTFRVYAYTPQTSRKQHCNFLHTYRKLNKKEEENRNVILFKSYAHLK